ncbi:DNA-binding transcriptional LysR family regulator [Polaromonas sp. CG_9.5]|uniref:LysR family transcriptional regulator n=1 Tax=Polaromonas sp. CG_9.5 TaxID=3071705 RepID=UPI002E0A7574|nr:DNA-binding transcriptional LysR family regulator [Polaromonas sp. CG_9.5]
MLDLQQLNCFVVLAEQLHFGRAAACLHISQPPLSLKIRALENKLGLQLFLRSSRHVELTHSGEILLHEARRLLRDAEQLTKLAASLELGEAGALAIGYNAVMSYRLMPNLVAAFSERFPRVKLSLHEMVSAEQITALREHRLDVGLLRPPVPKGFQTLPLGNEEMLVFLPANHPLAAQDAIEIEALASEPMVMFSKLDASYLHYVVVDMCAEAGFMPITVQETRHIHAIVALVGTGMGVALLPASATHIHMNGVKVRPLKASSTRAAPRRAQSVLAVIEGNANPVARHFMQVARNVQF